MAPPRPRMSLPGARGASSRVNTDVTGSFARRGRRRGRAKELSETSPRASPRFVASATRAKIDAFNAFVVDRRPTAARATEGDAALTRFKLGGNLD